MNLKEAQNSSRQEHGINIPSTQDHRLVLEMGPKSQPDAASPDQEDTTSTTSKPPPNLASGELINGSREKFLEICVPMFQASVTGNWAAAMVMLAQHPELVRCAITESYDTALHVAAAIKYTKQMEIFVRNLVALMDEKDLEFQNDDYNTALFLAIAAGNKEFVDIMLKKNQSLLLINGIRGRPVLYMSVLHKRYNLAKEFYDASPDLSEWSHKSRGWLIDQCVECDLFDMALRIAHDHPELAYMHGVRTLKYLARKPNAFNNRVADGNLYSRIVNSIIMYVKVGSTKKENDAVKLVRLLWTQFIKNTSRDKIDERLKSSQLLFVATEIGNTSFVVELIRIYPDVMWKTNDDKHTIFHIAVYESSSGYLQHIARDWFNEG
ncbi:uncharacterized protein [Rutidosis leptorrhynchoides]|uniref:uncharacterized protein n=1 Tax=Rutidosis leptorrhynchoides TaxID=125765 RepID=UPI003A990EB9